MITQAGALRGTLLVFVATVACAPQGADLSTRPAPSPEPPQQEEAKKRAQQARQRLEQTEVGRRVLRAIDYHGGLENWFDGGALAFRYDYHPVDNKPRRNSLQTVDLLRSRVYHEVSHPVIGRMAFDGNVAWSTFRSPEMPVRFWNLTPYYFVAMPFVLGDPGVVLTAIDDDPRAAGLGSSDVVRITFGAEVGDAPDDYYIAYLAQDDGRLLGLRYIVSYKPFFVGKNRQHNPEKLVVYDQQVAVGPLTLATRHRFYDFSTGKKGALITNGTVSEFQYGAAFDEARIRQPRGAYEDTALEEMNAR